MSRIAKDQLDTSLVDTTTAQTLTNKDVTSGTNTFPTFNQNTTGSAATLTTARTIQTDLTSASSAPFNGSANITPGVTGILAAANGGTSNGFTAFTGPATPTKTFTLPNATSTILTSNAAVTVAQGGTGRATGTTVYGLVAVGTTATGAQQTISPGTSGQFLKSAGAAALGSFANITSADLSDVATLATLTGSQTMTNKRVTKRTNTTTSSATPAINTDTTDEFTITALATNITSMTSSLTGTPVNGDELMIRFKDNGTARTITWGASFVSSGVATLLATTVISKTHYVLVRYDSTAAKFVCMAVDAVGY